jgi:hypothetical protein
MRCGEKSGHLTKDGTLCQQPIPATAKGCIWYVRTPEERSLLATKGSLASRMKRALPATYACPEFTETESIIAFARELGRLALTADVDMRRLAEARGAAQLALSAHSVQAQARMVDALLALEHGGQALVLLSQFQAAQSDPSKRRPLPGKVLAMPPTTEPA